MTACKNQLAVKIKKRRPKMCMEPRSGNAEEGNRECAPSKSIKTCTDN